MESSKAKYVFQGFIINNDYAVISGTIIAKNNASYQTKFPEKYRPKIRTGLSFPVPKTESVVAMATVYLYPDGTVKTEHPYPDQICVGTVMYKLN